MLRTFLRLHLDPGFWRDVWANTVSTALLAAAVYLVGVWAGVFPSRPAQAIVIALEVPIVPVGVYCWVKAIRQRRRMWAILSARDMSRVQPPATERELWLYNGTLYSTVYVILLAFTIVRTL